MIRYSISPNGESFAFAAQAAQQAADTDNTRYGVVVLTHGDVSVKCFTSDDLATADEWIDEHCPPGCWWLIVSVGRVIDHGDILLIAEGSM